MARDAQHAHFIKPLRNKALSVCYCKTTGYENLTYWAHNPEVAGSG